MNHKVPIPVNVILFGNMVFSHRTKFKWSYWIRRALTPITYVLIRRERCGDTWTHQSKGGHVMMKGETGVMQLQAKGSGGSPVASRSWTRQGPAMRAWPCQHPDFTFLAFETYGKI